MKKSALSFLLVNKDQNYILETIYKKIQANEGLNINDLAKDAYISVSAITRYFKENGFDGFKEFKYLLLSEKENIFNENKVTISSENFNQEFIFDPILKTDKFSDEQLYEKLYTELTTAKINYIYAVGGNHTIAYELKTRLQRMGFVVIYNFDYHEMYSTVSNMQSTDLLWLISYSGETLEIINLAKIAQRKKASTIAITRNAETSLTKLSDFVLKIDESEELTRIFSIKSHMSMLYVVEKFAYYVYTKNQEKFLDILMKNMYKK